MKIEVYRSIYAIHELDASVRTLYSTWLPSTAQMTAGEFKQEMENWLAISKNSRVLRIFDFCADFIYPIAPAEQVWMAHLLNPGWIEAGLEKYAHIVPQEFIANLSVDQMFEEFYQMNLSGQFAIRHYAVEEAEAALQWLFS